MTLLRGCTMFCFGACVSAPLLLVRPGPAAADGALALGVPNNVAQDGFAYGRNVDSPTEEQATEKALSLCRTAKDASPQARNLCTVVQRFHHQCVALAMDPKAGTPGWGTAVAATKEQAQKSAMANCYATAGADRRQYCVVSDVACDTK